VLHGLREATTTGSRDQVVGAVAITLACEHLDGLHSLENEVAAAATRLTASEAASARGGARAALP
jgi:hypothetical protein